MWTNNNLKPIIRGGIRLLCFLWKTVKKGTVKSAQIYVKNACYSLRIALLLHKMTPANKSLIFLNSSVLVIWCLTKRKLDKLQEKPTVMDTEEMLIKLFQSLYLLCQCFNSSCFQRLFCHLSCIQLYLRRWVHFLYLSSLFWLGIYVSLTMTKQNELL